MAKMTVPIKEVSRLLDLVPYLSTHSYISLKDLANEFGVTEREITSELTALSMCGATPYELIDVTFDSGYVTIRDHDSLDIPRALSNLEVASLLIGLEIMRDGASGEYIDLVAKIDSLIAQLIPLVGQIIEVETHPQALHSAALQQAIAQRSLVEISYESSLAGDSSSRVIEPLSIYREKSHTYLNAYCHRARGYRNFRIDRILAIQASSQKSTSSPSPESESGEESARELFALRADGRKRAIAEFLQLEGFAGDGRVEISAFSLGWVGKAIASFAPNLLLAEPPTARDEVCEQLRNILALYRS